MGAINTVNARALPGLIEAPGRRVPLLDQAQAPEGKFTDMVKDLLQSVNDLGLDAAQAQEALLSGEPVELHQVMIKAEEAGISLDLLLEIRNKLLDAYNQMMRMSL